jgi:hypothetical protein
MAVANTLAYYVTATITAVKSFIVQAPVGPIVIKLFTTVNYKYSVISLITCPCQAFPG